MDERTPREQVGAKVREFRTMFGVPRSIVQEQCGLSYNTLYRVEIGDRGMSAASLAKIVLAQYEIMRRVNVHRRLEYISYMMDLMRLVAQAETQQRGR